MTNGNKILVVKYFNMVSKSSLWSHFCLHLILFFTANVSIVYVSVNSINIPSGLRSESQSEWTITPCHTMKKKNRKPSIGEGVIEKAYLLGTHDTWKIWGSIHEYKYTMDSYEILHSYLISHGKSNGAVWFFLEWKYTSPLLKVSHKQRVYTVRTTQRLKRAKK